MNESIVAQKGPYAIEVEKGGTIIGVSVAEAINNPSVMVHIKGLILIQSSIKQ